MCGIAGVLSANPKQAETAVRAMNRIQAHRGPDDEGLKIVKTAGGDLALGHRRLSILDLSAAGHQPMLNPATGDWISYNGEIYNYPALRRELESAGAVFRSRSDTEVILHAYAQWGSDCFRRLNGMFAIALYDARQEMLLLARDHFGIKPLYYAVNGQAIVFASTMRAIHASGLVAADIDRVALAGLLAYGAVQGPRTLLRESRLLNPGTCVAINLAVPPRISSDLRMQRFWDFPAPHGVDDRPEAVAQVHDHLRDAVRRHLLSDVPIGLFLSSGLDSTALAMLCAHAAPEAVNTFTVSLEGSSEFDENPLAAETARLIGARHQAIALTKSEVCAQAERWFDAIDQPTIDGLNTFIISSAVRECGIKVALSGMGGDELFGGYSCFKQLPRLAPMGTLARCVPRAQRGMIAEALFAGISPTQRRKVRDMAMSHLDLPALTLGRRRLFSADEIHGFGFDRRALELNENYLPPEAELQRGIAGRDPQSVISILESRFYMGNMLLRDADVFGMAHGLEIRVPFLDRQLADYVLSLPGKWRVMRKGINKPLLVDAMGSDLRRDILCRRKTGFSLPYADWMTGPLRDRCEAMIDTLKCSNMVNSDAVAQTWQDFLRHKGASWSRAWMLVVLGEYMNLL
jgi:asparagine synthase (glutamine-hydrolysing)